MHEQIDWNTELRKIERQFDGLPPLPSASVIKARKERERRAREEVEARLARVGAAGRLLLVATLAGALWWWPYATACGIDLAALLGAEAMIVVGGAWAAVHAWRHRLAASHTLAIALLVTGLALVSAQVLPRIGVATVAGVEGTRWRCDGW